MQFRAKPGAVQQRYEGNTAVSGAVAPLSWRRCRRDAGAMPPETVALRKITPGGFINIMKKFTLLMLVALTAACVAMAQTPPGQGLLQTDVLGAHNGWGRGCVMCHAPHGGAAGNGHVNADTQNGEFALWGEDLTPLYGKTISFSGDGKTTSYPVTLPSAGSLTSAHDALTVILMCLSCHDGATAKVSMMRGTTVEQLPIVGGHAPTLFGTTPGNTATYYANEHPVGPNATVGCGGGHNWDCAGGVTTTPITMSGPASAQFLINNPSSFWNNWSVKGGALSTNSYAGCLSPGAGVTCTTSNPLATFTSGGTTITVNGVGCTVCHDQHSMIAYTNSKGSFPTSFFINGQYTPTNGGNAVAQFCRNCHGGESNEMNGITNIPTM